MNDPDRQLPAAPLCPPDDGGRHVVPVAAGQVLCIDCELPVAVLVVREAADLEIDFGLSGSIRLANAVLAARMQPVPAIVGREGDPLGLDRLLDAFAAGLAVPYGGGVALPAVLDRRGLHPGVPAVLPPGGVDQDGAGPAGQRPRPDVVYGDDGVFDRRGPTPPRRLSAAIRRSRVRFVPGDDDPAR